MWPLRALRTLLATFGALPGRAHARLGEKVFTLDDARRLCTPGSCSGNWPGVEAGTSSLTDGEASSLLWSMSSFRRSRLWREEELCQRITLAVLESKVPSKFAALLGGFR